MPVVDHPVHPKTVDTGKWGCYNRPDFNPWYMAKAQVLVMPVLGKLISFIGVYKLVKIKYSNSMECVHGRNGGDPKCQDCFRRKSTSSTESNSQ